MDTEVNEIVRPAWRNAEAYADVLNEEQVKAKIKDSLVAKHKKCHGVRFGETPNEEIQLTFAPLLHDLRLFDTKHIWYWLLSFALVVVYVLMEYILVATYQIEYQYLNGTLVFLLIFLISFLLLSIIVLTCEHEDFGYIRSREFLHKLLKKPMANLYTWPVLITSIGLAVINFVLVARSGWQKSPFLPALIFVAMNIISAPRENNRYTLVLVLIASLFILVPFLAPALESPEPISKEEGDLAWWLNLGTLLLSIIIRVVQRHVNTIKIGGNA